MAVLLFATSNSFAQASFETIDGIRYLLDSDAKTATVMASSDEKYSGEVVVPEKVTASDGTEFPVTAIGDNAFKECSGLTSITIPSSVTSLGSSCFYKCSSLTSITIPSSVTSLGSSCFASCTGLTSIPIPSSVTSLGNYCFYGCSGLTGITIPSSVTYLGGACFEYCSGLTSVIIPSSITSLETGCFSYCSGLTSVIIPSSVTSLGLWCFRGCTSLTSITIPSSVTSLGIACFQYCTGLTSITIPSSVTSLGNYCFQYCSGLTSITIPSSVTSMGELCFNECSSLTDVIIPSSVTSLEEGCFNKCSSLASVTIPSSVTSLGGDCFCECSSLTSITIPSSVTSLGYDCFKDCTKLEQATFKGKLPAVTLGCGLLSTCILYVPKAYLQDYKDALGSKYAYIYASKEDGEEEKPVTACATPTITYGDGKLLFNSSTPNAEYHATITDTDMTNDKYIEDGVLDLSAAYHISAYATADGYKQSEKATAVLYWLKSNATLDDGTSTNINQAKTRGIVATSHNGIITLSGLDNGEEVRFYSVDGKQIGAAKAINGIASQAVSSASLIIAKIGGQAIKIAVK